MRIAYLMVKSLGREGGIENYTRQLGQRLLQKGHSVTVYTMSRYGPGKTDPHPGFREVRLPSLPVRSLEKLSASLLAAFHAARSPDELIHFHSVAAGFFALLPRFYGKKTVLQLHGTEWKRERWGFWGKLVLRALEWVAVRCCDACVSVSRSHAQYLNRRGRPVAYVPNAVDLPPRRGKGARALGGRPYVLCVCRVVREKGVDLAVRAFQSGRLDADLWIAGGFDRRSGYVRNLLKDAGANLSIRFLGEVPQERLEYLYRGARLFLLPSKVEGMSLSLLEAMSYGCPCLVSDIPENREVLGPGGFTFPSGDVPALKKKLAEILNRPRELRRAGLAARQRVREEFTWRKTLRGLLDVYESLSQDLDRDRFGSGLAPSSVPTKGLPMGLPSRA